MVNSISRIIGPSQNKVEFHNCWLRSLYTSCFWSWLVLYQRDLKYNTVPNIQVRVLIVQQLYFFSLCLCESCWCMIDHQYSAAGDLERICRKLHTHSHLETTNVSDQRQTQSKYFNAESMDILQLARIYCIYLNQRWLSLFMFPISLKKKMQIPMFYNPFSHIIQWLRSLIKL